MSGNGSTTLPWRLAPSDLHLADRDVHVWKAALDLPPARVQELVETLSPDERARAGRFVFAQDRWRFIGCRGLLRALLSRYLGAAASALPFQYSSHGKPSISADAGNTVCFNVSHAGGMALFGITKCRRIGIDLERVRSDVAFDEIAEQYFSDREIASLRALSLSDRVIAFFRCWTRKEAYIKARGEGLSLPLKQFDVSLRPSEPAALLATPDDPQEASRWSLKELLAGPEYVAAIAVEGHDWRLRCFRYPEAETQ